jgi:hypothetical protein
MRAHEKDCRYDGEALSNSSLILANKALLYDAASAGTFAAVYTRWKSPLMDGSESAVLGIFQRRYDPPTAITPDCVVAV